MYLSIWSRSNFFSESVHQFWNTNLFAFPTCVNKHTCSVQTLLNDFIFYYLIFVPSLFCAFFHLDDTILPAAHNGAAFSPFLRNKGRNSMKTLSCPTSSSYPISLLLLQKNYSTGRIFSSSVLSVPLLFSYFPLEPTQYLAAIALVKVLRHRLPSVWGQVFSLSTVPGIQKMRRPVGTDEILQRGLLRENKTS